MGPLYLLDLASQQSRWLGLRQSAIAGNISNVSTPGYRAQDVRPFDDVLARTGLDMAQTSAGHMHLESGEARGRIVKSPDSWETTLSGNSVNAEEQLMKAGEVSRGYALNTGVVRAFHRMMLASVKV
ncbi:MAG: flgB [Hyphomicrobiales bacterium]|nr:flgB [Hyphomicrobiales bacterium]